MVVILFVKPFFELHTKRKIFPGMSSFQAYVPEDHSAAVGWRPNYPLTEQVRLRFLLKQNFRTSVFRGSFPPLRERFSRMTLKQKLSEISSATFLVITFFPLGYVNFELWVDVKFRPTCQSKCSSFGSSSCIFSGNIAKNVSGDDLLWTIMLWGLWGRAHSL